MSDELGKDIIYTDKARCRDCYRCVRHCPVDAIMMDNGQASVVIDKCIMCGTCVIECPQDAKHYRNDTETFHQLLLSSSKKVVSIAPSFAAFYNSDKYKVISALRQLGIDYVEETSIGAYYVSNETVNYVNDNNTNTICSACPSVISYIEKYKTELVDSIAPIKSPMLVHADMIKQKHGDDCKLIFIGPCISKKYEADNYNKIDCVLTFEEMELIFEKNNIVLEQLEESEFDDHPHGNSKLFPLTGGLYSTAEKEETNLSKNNLSVTGFDELVDSLEFIKDNKNVVVEPLLCKMGCINGPGVISDKSLFQRRNNVINYKNETFEKESSYSMESSTDLSKNYSAQNLAVNEYDIEEIKKVYRQTGKHTDEDLLNCGACGYNSCKEKAIAVLNGMAEVEMCMPYSRKLAEQRSDKIIETSPNGIVILDDQLKIIHMNQSFMKLFHATDELKGKNISTLMDPEPFILIRSNNEIFEKTIEHKNYNLITHQIHYKIMEANQIVGIFVNVTNSFRDKEDLNSLRKDTIVQARELLNHQLGLAQNIARYLGESSAKSEELIEKMIQLTGQDKDDNNKKNWLWDIYSSK